MTASLRIAPLLFLVSAAPTLAAFYPGRVGFAVNEFPKLSGRMSTWAAVSLCERHPECAGFAINAHAVGGDEDTEVHIAFFRLLAEVSSTFEDLDWMFYVVDRPVATYTQQLPEQGIYSEWINKDLVDFLQQNNGLALAYDRISGTIRFYRQIDLGSMKKNERWTTYLNLRLPHSESVIGLNQRLPIDLCCFPVPMREIPIDEVQPRGDVNRVSCNISREEFTDRFIRPMKPAIITSCDYSWLEMEAKDLSVEGVIKAYHDNSTISEELSKMTEYHEAAHSFTLLETPNDLELLYTPQIVAQLLDMGFLRMFHRIRHNINCEIRPGSDCHVFQRFHAPPPIPDDLYARMGFGSDLGWVIASQANTGSHPHSDPDLTGAWNYLINGYKWWVIFPYGIKAQMLNCDESCTPNMEDVFEAYRWYHCVLPKLRHVKMYGTKPLEFVQSPGEAVYLPHGVPHAVLNLRDNVAVTENFLFVDALPELMTKVVLDEISAFRPGWDQRGIHKLYNQLTNIGDRAAMRRAYSQAIKYINANPTFCDEAAKARRNKLEQIAARKNSTEAGIYGA